MFGDFQIVEFSFLGFNGVYLVSGVVQISIIFHCKKRKLKCMSQAYELKYYFIVFFTSVIWSGNPKIT